jgi:hypothetical protein
LTPPLAKQLELQGVDIVPLTRPVGLGFGAWVPLSSTGANGALTSGIQDEHGVKLMRKS